MKDNPSNNAMCWEMYEGEDYEFDHYEDASGVALEFAPSEVGSYKAIYRGIGKYHGQREFEFSIVDPYDIASYELNDRLDWEVVGTDGETSPQVHMVFNRGNSGREGTRYYDSLQDKGLRQGVDFKVTGYEGLAEGEVPSSGGWHNIVVEGIGGYSGVATCPLRLFSKKLDLNDDYRGAGVYDRYKWTGSPVQLRMDFFFQQDISPVAGRDYEFVAFDTSGNELSELPSNGGSYSYTIRALPSGRCTGTYQHACDFSIYGDPFDLSGGVVSGQWSGSGKYACNGGPVALSEVEFRGANGQTLTEGADYKFSRYESRDGNVLSEAPSEVGNYYAVFEGIRSYRGEYRLGFSIIEPFDLSSLTKDNVSYNATYYRSSLNDDLTNMSVRIYTGSDMGWLRSQGNFQLVYYDSEGNELPETPTRDGSYSFKLKAIDGGFCKGETSIFFPLEIRDRYCISDQDWNSVQITGSETFGWDADGRLCFYFDEDGAVKPRVYAYKVRSGYQKLAEGIDYELSYSNNAAPVEEDTVATVTVTGIGDYYGSVTLEFVILSKVDLSVAVHGGGSNKIMFGSESYYFPSSSDIEFFTTGYAVKPSIVIGLRAYNSYGEWRHSSGFVVSYVDSEGRAVDPVEPGSYKAILTATDDGIFRGSAEVPFSLVETKDLSSISDLRYGSMTINYSPEAGYVRHASSSKNGDGAWMYGISAVLDSVKSLGVSLFDSGRSLIEGLDYVLTVVRDGVYEYLTIQGIGKYTGTVRATVYGQSWQELLDAATIGVNRTVRGWLYDSRVRDVVYATSDGVLETPLVDSPDLVQGVDYEVAGVFNTEGQQVFSISENNGSNLFVKVVGKGRYEGCQRLLPVDVRKEQHLVDLSGYWSCDVIVKGSVYNEETGGLFALSSSLTSVGLKVYEYNAVLSDGEGVSIVSQLDASSGKATVTAEALDGSGLTGKTSKEYSVVDAFSLPSLLTGVGYSAPNGRKDATILDDGTFEIPSFAWKYNGFSYTPSLFVQAGCACLDDPSYDVAFFDESGNQTDGIVGAGTYTIQITGKGDWQGAVSGKATVTDDSAIPLPESSITVNGRTSGAIAPLIDGSACPDVVLRYHDYTLVEGVDYSLSYQNNTTEGSAFVVAKAIDGSRFIGETSCAFKVSDTVNIADAGYGIYVPDASGDYILGGARFSSLASNASAAAAFGSTDATPEISVLASGDKSLGYWRGQIALDLDPSCYDVEYGNNNAAGIAWVKVTGKNGYTGSISANYRILDFSSPLSAVACVSNVVVNNMSTLTCAYSGASTDGIVYEWQGSADNGETWFHSGCAGQGTSELKVASNEGNGKLLFRCKVTDSQGREAYTDPVSILVLPKLALTAASSEPVDGKSSLSVSVSGDAGYALQYEWQGSVNGGKGWFRSGCEGQGTAELKVPANAGNAGMLFRCVVRAEDGRETTTSPMRISLGDPITVSVKALSPVNAKSPLQAFVENAGDATVSYVWQASANGGKSWFRSGCEGQGTAELKVPTNAGNAGLRFRCVATTSDGRTATSAAAQISLGDPLNVSVNSAYPVAGKSALTVFVSGAGSAMLSYEWQGSVNGVNWFRSGCEGQGTATLKVPANSGNAALKFRCVVTASDGRTANSSPIAIIVNQPLNAFAMADAPAGGLSMLTVNVFNVDGSQLSYVWQASSNNGKSWYRSGCKGQGTSQLLVPANAGNAASLYRCVVAASDGRVATCEPIKIRLE